MAITSISYDAEEAAKVIGISQKEFVDNENEFLRLMFGGEPVKGSIAEKMFQKRFSFVTYIHN